MAVCKQSPEELIQDVFSPVLAVLCSSEADSTCRKNNLSFVELVQPFCRLSSEVSIRDLSLVSYTLRNARIIIKDIKSQPYAPALTKKMLSDTVTNIQGETSVKNTLTVQPYVLKYCRTTPWFEAYRNVFFQVFYPTEHEFTNRFIGCIYVVSSSHADPLSQLHELVQEQLIHQQNAASKWFCPNICKYFVLIHDVGVDDLSKAEAAYQSIKNLYGTSQCHFLQINSASVTDETVAQLPDPWNQFLTPSSDQNSDSSKPVVDNETNHLPDVIENPPSSDAVFHPLSTNNFESLSPPDVKGHIDEDWILASKHLKESNYGKHHGRFLSSSDRDRVKVFIHEFFTQCLIPYAERQTRILNDQVMNRKGLHRSIFSATKKWFGSNKPGQPAPGNSANSVVYSQDAPELQVRKLGDIAFMFQLYEVAYQAYHSAKKEFGSDQAWIHYAGALEMAAYSIFLQGKNSQRQFPYHYLENAITTYLNSSKQSQFATRTTLLSTETLKSKGMYSEAAQLFIRMTSEDSDLLSALLLEQASLCFLHSKPRMLRKYAFHIILAGHRFSKAGQRKHALRCYQQALEVYQNRQWFLASDHIYFTIGRQSVNLKLVEQACEAFYCLLTSRKQQSAVQQGTYLKEYLFVLKQFLADKSDDKTLPALPVPIINCQLTKVLLGRPSELATDNFILVDTGSFSIGDERNSSWVKLEEFAYNYAADNKGLLMKPHLNCLSNKTNNSAKPNIVVEEPLSVELSIKNPLLVGITLSNVHLVWEFLPENGSVTQPISNETLGGKTALLNEIVDTEIVPEIKFEGLQDLKVHLTLRPKQLGNLKITAVAFTLLSQAISSQTSVSNDLTSSTEESSKPPARPSSFTTSVRGKLILEVKGPRLNNTKVEKTSVLYGPDYRLEAVIINHMPKLQAKFYDFTSNLLCGEVKLINVQFTNIGQCPLQRLIVASPTPEVFVFGSYGAEESESYSYLGYAARTTNNGNSSTSPVMVEWKKITRVSELFMHNGSYVSLEPGASIMVPLWIRGPDTPGSHHVDLLFYYETTSQMLAKLRYRLLQHTFEITTTPSVNLKAAVRRSFTPVENHGLNANNLIASLQCDNLLKDQSTSTADISIVQVNGASQNWWIKSLGEPTASGSIHVKPLESLHMNFHVFPFTAKHTVASQEVMVFSQIPLERTAVESSAAPCSEFCLRSLLHGLAPLVPESEGPPPYQETLVPNSDLEALEGCNAVNLTLTVIWKATVQRDEKFFVVMGQHHVTVEQLTPFTPINTPLLPILNPQITNESYMMSLAEKLVKCVFLHEVQVDHNFKKQRLAMVPVQLVLSNCCNKSVLVEVNLAKDEESLSQYSMESWQVAQYSWSGLTKYNTTLQPSASFSISLRAIFSLPGTFNLSAVRVYAKLSNSSSEYTLQEQLAPSLLIINAVNLK